MPKSPLFGGSLSAGVFACALAGAVPAPAAVPATQPNPPATQPADSLVPNIQPTTRATTRPVKRISLNFKDAPLDVVLDHLSEAAGLVVIKEGQVEGRVTVQSTEPVTPEEAVTLINAVLKANGFSAVQNGRVVRIALRAKVKKESVPVHVGAEPTEIAATEEIITQVIPLKNVDAVKLRQDLTPLIGPDADVTANAASNSIVMTDSSANIRRVVQVIAALDLGQTSSTELRVIHLKFADATVTAKLMTAVFRPAEGGGGGMTPQQMQMMQQQGMAVPQGGGGGAREGRIPGGAIDQALRGGHVRADADERTNSIILTAPSATLKVIEDIIKELDSNPIPASQLKAFHLNFADAGATARLISDLFKGERSNSDFPFFNPFGGMGEKASQIKVNITSDERTNSVIVSAPAEALKAIGDLIKDLDSAPGAGLEIRTFQLKYADAYYTAKMIMSIFEPDDKNKGDNGFRFIFFGPQPPSSSKGPKVTATSDDRTNTLVVTGPKEAMKPIEELVTKLDANTASDESLFIYRLRNAQAANLELVLNTLFGNTNNQQNQQNQGQNPNGQPGQQNQGQQGPGGRNGAGASSGNLSGGTGIGARHGQRNGQGTGPGQRNSAKLSGGLAKAATEMAGEVFVVADSDTNSLIVTTASKYKDSVREIIKELDRPAPQVLIKVLVAEVTHDNSADWGLDFSILNKRANGNGDMVGTSLGNSAAASNGGLVVSLMENNLNIILHALATEGKLDVLSRPYILASDNQLATITVGQEVPFITNTQLTDAGQQINTIQYQDVGIILNVTPHINPEGLVILDVSPEISQLSSGTVPISAGVSAPIIDKRSADSRVAIKNGQTIVIGGLMQDQKTSTISKVPLIGDIPYLGELFKRTQISKTKTELLIFLTPHVALQPDTLNGMSQEEMRGTRLTPGAVAPGVFQEHMQGLRNGATSETKPAEGAATEPVRDIRGDTAKKP